MRVLHTSDWHLGRSFHGADLADAQAAVLGQLVDVVAAEGVELVVVAGDLYDRALPPVAAVELWTELADRLIRTGATVVVISGNHDSARRLAGHARLLEAARLHVRTDPARAHEPVLLPLDGGQLAVYPVPYLDPVVAGEGTPAGQARTHAAVLRAAVQRCRQDAARRAGCRSLLVAHAFVAGGQECDSERELAVGGAGAVPAGTFAGFDYVALGHLHGRQVLGEGRLRYSGSPLAYSFSEEAHRKGAWLLDVTREGLQAVVEVPLAAPRGLARLRGTLEELLTSREFDAAEACWVAVTLTDPACPAGAMPRLQRRFPHAVALQWQPPAPVAGAATSYAARVAHRDDLHIVAEFVQHVSGVPMTDDERELVVAAMAPAGDAVAVG